MSVPNGGLPYRNSKTRENKNAHNSLISTTKMQQYKKYWLSIEPVKIMNQWSTNTHM